MIATIGFNATLVIVVAIGCATWLAGKWIDSQAPRR
jgi:hypothetical protein